MSFQGADVDGLDRTANRCMEGADFADTVAKALEVLVAALEAMSWTGFAAALAAYLKAVVIPWVKYIAKCLRIFGGLLQLASSKQKDASLDAPPVSIPATAWNPPPAPVATGITPPRLASPQPAIRQTDPGTGAQAGGGTSVTPIASIGRTEGGAGSATVTPATVTTPTAISAPGVSGGLSTGSGGQASSVTPVIRDPFGSGSTLGGTPTAPAGPGAGGGTGGGAGSSSGPATGSIGTGAVGPIGGTSTPGDDAAITSTGDPGVQSSPLASRAVLGSPSSSTGTNTVEVPTATTPTDGGGTAAAFAAAPLGLAGVGGAALAALRAKGLRDGDDDEGEDDAL